MINIQYEFDPKIDTPSEKISTEIISSVLMEEGMTLAEILVIFTSDEILSDLKKEFFNKEHLTDVISFRINDYNEEKVEGEIYISIPQVERNARKFDQSFSRELSRIIIHGSLHLLNYDDSTIYSKIKMTEKEDYFLKKTNWKNLV